MYKNSNHKNKDFDNRSNNNIINSLSLLFSELKNKEQNQSFQPKINDVILTLIIEIFIFLIAIIMHTFYSSRMTKV